MFDERGINKLFEVSPYSIYLDLPFADLKIRSFNFQVQHFKMNLSSIVGVFYWNRGKLFRLFVREEEIFAEEFAYVHFLKRKIDINEFNFEESFFVVPNKLVSSENVSDLKKFIAQHSAQKFYAKYFMERINLPFFLKKRKLRKSEKKI